MKTGEIKNAVKTVLKENERAKNNDIYMRALALRKLGLPTDLFKLAEMFDSDILETMRRDRQEAQKIDPFLGPTEKTAKHRRMKERKMRKNARTI